jgi:hypothetical protein
MLVLKDGDVQMVQPLEEAIKPIGICTFILPQV